jgi:hypothetical protein
MVALVLRHHFSTIDHIPFKRNKIILTDESIWHYVTGKGKPGAQIDLLIDRADHCISVCEMKFSVNTLPIDKRYADELQNKLSVFADESKTKKTLMLVMVTTFGVKDNVYRNSLIQNEIIIKDLLF